MGSVVRRVRKSGVRFQVRIRLKGADHITKFFLTEEEAWEFVHATEAMIREGKPPEGFLRLPRMLEQWNKTRSGLAPSTLAGDKQVSALLLARFGNMRIHEITPYMLDELRDQFAAGRQPSTVKLNMTRIKGIFRWCVRKQLLTNNPMDRVDLPRVRKRTPRALSNSEANALLKEAKEIDEMYPIICLALTTGMRKGEILGLNRSEVDLEHSRIVLPAERRKNNGPLVAQLVGPMVEILGDELDRSDHPLVFAPKRAGAKCRSIDRPWKRVKEKAGVNIRFHDLRHTAGSWLSSEGMPLRFVQQVLGHESIRSTEIYSHLEENSVRRQQEEIMLKRLPALRTNSPNSEPPPLEKVTKDPKTNRNEGEPGCCARCRLSMGPLEPTGVLTDLAGPTLTHCRYNSTDSPCRLQQGSSACRPGEGTAGPDRGRTNDPIPTVELPGFVPVSTLSSSLERWLQSHLQSHPVLAVSVLWMGFLLAFRKPGWWPGVTNGSRTDLGEGAEREPWEGRARAPGWSPGPPISARGRDAGSTAPG